MLGDLVAALSGANPDDNIVHYMLIYEQDLALSPEIGVVKPAELLSKFQTLA
jgi:hypothetical protein